MPKTVAPPAKILRPASAHLLQRPRIFSALGGHRHARCLWIGAAAGSGKTSSVSSWIDHLERPCLWYQCDAGDADPATVFHYLTLATHQFDEVTEHLLPRFSPENMPGLDMFARRYFEQLHARFDSPFVVVFDNVHEVAEDSPFALLLHLALQTLPPHGLMVVLSRGQPGAAFADWQAQVGFEAYDESFLRLTDPEAQGLAEVLGRPAASIQALNTSVHGWVAGYVLLLRARHPTADAPFAADTLPQVVFDYLAHEVFAKLDGATQDFLIQTAALPSMSAALAQAVTGQVDAHHRLAVLHRQRLFIECRRGAPDRVYEFHPLLREFLLQRAESTLSAAALAALRLRCAECLAAAGQVEAAAQLWAAAGNWPALTGLVLSQAPRLMQQGRVATLATQILLVPPEVRAGAPWLMFWLGVCQSYRSPADGRALLAFAFGAFKAESCRPGEWLALSAILSGFFHQWGDMKPLDPWITEFERLHAEHLGSLPVEFEVQVFAGALGILARRPDHPLLAGLARRAIDRMRQTDDPTDRLSVAGFAIAYLLWAGDYGTLKPLCDEALVGATDTANSPITIFLYLAIGTTMWQNAEHDAAIVALRKALAIGESVGIRFFDTLIHIQMAYNELSRGALDAGQVALDQALAALQAARDFDFRHCCFIKAGLLMKRGRLPEALALVHNNLPAVVDAGFPFMEHAFRIELGQLLMLDHQHEAAREQFDAALCFAQRMPSPILVFHARIGLARCALDTGARAEGLQQLSEALAIGSAQNYMNCHPWWIPDVMSALCALALREGIEPDYVRRLITKRGLLPPFDAIHLDHWPWRVRIITLQQFQVTVDGAPLRFSTKAQKKPVDLLKVLVAGGERSLTLATVAHHLWPDQAGDAALNALHTTVHRLRHLLGDDGAIQIHEGRIALSPQHARVDSWAVERCLVEIDLQSSSRAEPLPGWAQGAASSLLRLYPGPFLHDEQAPWAVACRERLSSKFLRVGQLLGRAMEARAAWDDAIHHHQRILEVEPTAEDTHRALMRALIQAGRHAEAVQAYRRCAQTLARLVGVAPSPATEALRRSICI
jgi:ATP/maltotriose-dependent transcriptional regulator MalT/DNA-binding SARP family transcriptional activator